MTMRSFGRVMPIHIHMLRLAGYVPDYGKRDIQPATTDEECQQTIRDGRTELQRLTGRDFGYDLAAWREFLSSVPDDEFGYRHEYAFRGVDRAVRQAIENSQRKQLVKQLQEPPAEHAAPPDRRGE